MCLPTWRKGAIQLWLRERHLWIRSSRLVWPSVVKLWCLKLESAFIDVCSTGSRQVEGWSQAPRSCTQQSPDLQTYNQLQQRILLPHQTHKIDHNIVTSSDKYALTHLIHRMLHAWLLVLSQPLPFSKRSVSLLRVSLYHFVLKVSTSNINPLNTELNPICQ